MKLEQDHPNTPHHQPAPQKNRVRRTFSKFALFAATAFIALFGQAQAQDAIIFVHGFDPNYRNELTYRSQDCNAVFGNALAYYRARTTKPLVTFGL